MHVNEKHDDRFVHTAIHFFYPSFSFTIIKNHPENLVKWLSNQDLRLHNFSLELPITYGIDFSLSLIVSLFPGDVGGNLSLYLGASFVTLLEIFVLFFRCIRKCLRRQ